MKPANFLLKCWRTLPTLWVSMRGNGSGRLDSSNPGDAGGATRAAGGSVKDRPSGAKFAISRRDLEPGTTVVAVAGELDLASAPNLKWTLNDSISKGARRLVLDMSPVTFIDSTALGVLVGVQRNLRVGGRLALAGADTDPDVLNIFELTGLDSTFDMFSTIDEALAWVRGSEAAAG
jgi:anti-sigma B factor antagonist